MHPLAKATQPPAWRRLLRPLAGWWTGRGVEPVTFRLLGHLQELGVVVETGRRHGKPVRRREGKTRLTHWLLARLEVGLPRIQTIEVWRVVTRNRDATSVLEEITFLAPVGPGRDMTRLPILTYAAVRPGTGGGREIVWHGFEWGRLPLLRDRLAADGELNRRLLGHVDDYLAERIRARQAERRGG